MPKSFIQLVVWLLVPCLAAESFFATTRPFPSPRAASTVAFEQEAIAPALLHVHLAMSRLTFRSNRSASTHSASAHRRPVARRFRFATDAVFIGLPLFSAFVLGVAPFSLRGHSVALVVGPWVGLLLFRWISLRMLSSQKSFFRFVAQVGVGTLAVFTLGLHADYDRRPSLFLHDAHALVQRALYKRVPVIPGPGVAVTRSDGSVLYELERDNKARYTILKIPLATGEYQIKIKAAAEVACERGCKEPELEAYQRADPDAVAMINANYSAFNASEISQKAGSAEPRAAGLVKSHGQVLVSFDTRLTKGRKIGEGLLGLTKDGRTVLVKAPLQGKEIELLLANFVEAVQVGPILVDTDLHGDPEIPLDIRSDEASSWSWVALDTSGNIYLGTSLEGELSRHWMGEQTHRDLAFQIKSWSEANGIHIASAAALDGGYYTELWAKGFLPSDLRPVDSTVLGHSSMLMIVPQKSRDGLSGKK